MALSQKRLRTLINGENSLSLIKLQLLPPDNIPFNLIFLESLYYRKPPDLELEGLFKRHFTTVKFYQGSIMSTPDLQRVKVHKSTKVTSKTTFSSSPSWISLQLGLAGFFRWVGVIHVVQGTQTKQFTHIQNFNFDTTLPSITIYIYSTRAHFWPISLFLIAQ